MISHLKNRPKMYFSEEIGYEGSAQFSLIEMRLFKIKLLGKKLVHGDTIHLHAASCKLATLLTRSHLNNEILTSRDFLV